MSAETDAIIQQMAKSMRRAVGILQERSDGVQAQIDELTIQKDAITESILLVNKQRIMDKLDIRKHDWDVPGHPAQVTYDAGFVANTNIESWHIQQWQWWGVYLTVYDIVTSWDHDAELTLWMANWNVGYDFINHTVSGLDGSYGIQEKITNLETGNGIYTGDIAAFNTAVDVFFNP